MYQLQIGDSYSRKILIKFTKLPGEYVKHDIHNYWDLQYLYINSRYIKHDLYEAVIKAIK